MSFLKQMKVCFSSPWLTKFGLFELSWSSLLFWSQALLCTYWWEDLLFSSPPDIVTDRSLYKLLLVPCSKLMGRDLSIIVSDDVFTRAPMQPLLCAKSNKWAEFPAILTNWEAYSLLYKQNRIIMQNIDEIRKSWLGFSRCTLSNPQTFTSWALDQ